MSSMAWLKRPGLRVAAAAALVTLCLPDPASAFNAAQRPPLPLKSPQEARRCISQGAACIATASISLGSRGVSRKSEPRPSSLISAQSTSAFQGDSKGSRISEAAQKVPVLGKLLPVLAEAIVLLKSKVLQRLLVLFQNTWWVWFAPLAIGSYLGSVHLLAPFFRACPQCFDPMNILLLSIKIPGLPALPVCLWNLSHIVLYYLFMRTMPFRRTPSKHVLAIATGVLWYNVEPVVFAIMHPEASIAAHACSTLGVMTTVYESTWRPRLDDFVFNTSGQLIYEVHKMLRASQGKLDI